MNERTAVMLSDRDLDPGLAADLGKRNLRIASYRRLEDLFGEREPGSIPVLILKLQKRPKGRVLDAVARLALEHPRVGVVAVSESPFPIEVAEFLAGRGVELVESGPETVPVEELLDAVNRKHDWREVSLAAC